MTVTHITVTIDRTGAEQWLGDTDGLDIDATVIRYADLLQDVLEEDYPNAIVSVEVAWSGQHAQTPIAVRTSEGGSYTERDAADEQPVILGIQGRLDELHAGRHGEYAVVAAG